MKTPGVLPGSFLCYNEKMENNKIKPISLIITGVVVVAFIAIFVMAKKQQEVANAPTPADTTASAPASLCYVLNKKSTGSKFNDVAFVKLNTTDGGQTVTGELGTYLAEKDGMKGTLSGTVNADATGAAVFDGQYANSAEGMNNINEQLIKFDTDTAQIGYGEMVAAADGTYDYKDKTKVTYSLSIPSVDCAQYDALKTAAGH
jgi:hypothetical protein